MKAFAAAPADSALIAFVKASYFHGVPYQQGRDFGPHAIPTLKRLLNDDSYKPYWRNIVLTIGFIADRESYEILRSFTWNRFKGSIDSATLDAMLQVPSAMGCAAAYQRSPQILLYLEQGTDPATWARLPWSQDRYPSSELFSLLARYSVSGLGWTGSPEAERILARLTDHPHEERQRSIVSDARTRNKGVSTAGLAGYVDVWKKRREHREGK